jgi:hypothetical protein
VIRLHVIAEGRSEQAFVEKVLAPHLAGRGVFAVARCVLTSKDKRAGRIYRGGISSYERVRKDIVNWMAEQAAPECRFTTMFDLYALPNEFPGNDSAKGCADPYARVKALELALGENIGSRRFIPYIQLHEFETLILAEPSALDWEYLEHEGPIRNLQAMVGEQNPELINDGAETAPSKRIIKEIPEYDKVASGVSVVDHIGLPTLRQRCAHFNEWISRLERLESEA